MSLSEVFDTLQAFLGSTYVNDFDFNNRTYRVYVQAERAVPEQSEDLRAFYVADASGQMVPLGTVLQPSREHGPAGDQPLQSLPRRGDQR